MVKTQHFSQALEEDYASSVFLHLKENITWSDGVKTRTGGFTRKACPMGLDVDPVLDGIISKAIQYLIAKGVFGKGPEYKVGIYGIYLNYYRTGSDYTPNHSHPGTTQIVISLGTTRTLKVGNKDFSLENGDIILFGSATHGVPKDLAVIDGRISIAMFTQSE